MKTAEAKQRYNERTRLRRQTPEYKERYKAIRQSPEYKARQKEYRIKHRTVEWKRRQREIWLLKTYNLTTTDFDRFVSLQDGKCAICPKLIAETQICVDHNHVTGKVRGLLCHDCNTGIGRFKDNPVLLKNAAVYLETA